MSQRDPDPTRLPRGAETRFSSLTPQQKTSAAADRLRNPTSAESLVWERLKERRLDGFHFVREKEILGWYADFYCAAGRLVIEVDGTEHRHRVSEDNRRDEVMRANRYRVVRIPARKVYDDLEGILVSIREALDSDWARRRRDKFADRTTPKPQAAPLRNQGRRPRASSQRPTPRPTSTSRRNRRFRCTRCKRDFSVDINSVRRIECHRCKSADALRPICRSCSKAVKTVVSGNWLCRPCSDSRSVAWEAAGSGVTPTGPLHDKPGRAKRL